MTRWRNSTRGVAVSLVAILAVSTVAEATEPKPSDPPGNPPRVTDNPTGAGHEPPQFGGPASVVGQVGADAVVKVPVYHFDGLSKRVRPWFDFKQSLKQHYGLSFGGDYITYYQGASESLGENNAASGVFRIYGTWTFIGPDSPAPGALIFKAENRHRLGTDIAPQQLASELGYVGLTASGYSDAGTLLTNLYWQQSFRHNRLAYVAGIVDASDYVALSGLSNLWTDFTNQAFSTDPTIPIPSQGLGAAVRGDIKENYYMLAGLADSNGDPAHPFDNFDTFFNRHEFFKHIELGWYSLWKNRFTDNIHLTVWQVDERKADQVPDGWGASFSFNRKFNERWMPFFRVGYADGGDALLERSVSAGIGYFRGTRDDVLGVGLNWGRPPGEIDSPRLDDQWTIEVFYRLQLFPHMTITPDVQLLFNPAQNPQEDLIWVMGLRARLVF